MPAPRAVVLTGIVGGLIWASAVLWLGAQMQIPDGRSQQVFLGVFFAPGLIIAAMIGRVAQRRFFDDRFIDGQPFDESSGAGIDQRVLTNSVEQVVLAFCLWPLVGLSMGAGTVVVLSLSFVFARLLFWIGYHLSPPLRALGFAGTFYPTVAAALLAAFHLVRDAF